MAQPPAYNRTKDFGADYPDQTDNQAINTELDAVASSINGIRTNLAKIQRDDGGLRDGIVTKDSLAPSLKDDLYSEFSGNINDSVLAAQQAAADATNAAAAANNDASQAVAARNDAVAASTAAQSSAASASSSQSAAFGSASSAAASASAASGSASTAGTAATTATNAATAAVQARNEAVPAAATATTKASEASASATAAAASEDLAQQWASKMDGPVDGVKFSAEHYAALAAAGMGLPVRFLNDLPTANIGPIAVPTQGQMEWVAARSRYEVLQGDHGQCRFVYVSPTECRLMPCNGDGLIIGGRQFRIPAAGIALPIAAVSGAVGTSIYVYATDDGSGGITLEANTTGHSRHTDGTEIKAGDPARLLVGMAYKNSAGQFQHDSLIRGVSSWFNRTYAPAVYTNFNTGTASLTPVQAMGPIYVWTWDGESIEACVNGRVGTTTAGAASITYSYINGIQNWSAAATSSTAGANVPVCLFTPAKALAEGLQAVSTYLAVTGGTSACALTQSIQARP